MHMGPGMSRLSLEDSADFLEFEAKSKGYMCECLRREFCVVCVCETESERERECVCESVKSAMRVCERVCVRKCVEKESV